LSGRGFRPIGGSAFKADAFWIGADELEAIRLADVEGLYQDAAAERMGVSRQTYARILNRARTAVARRDPEDVLLAGWHRNLGSINLAEALQVFGEPLTIGLTGSQPPLDLAIAQKAASNGIHRDHL
jgi:predicted DNA-binding protein (UPF0251 family)